MCTVVDHAWIQSCIDKGRLLDGADDWGGCLLEAPSVRPIGEVLRRRPHATTGAAFQAFAPGPRHGADPRAGPSLQRPPATAHRSARQTLPSPMLPRRPAALQRHRSVSGLLSDEDNGRGINDSDEDGNDGEDDEDDNGGVPPDDEVEAIRKPDRRTTRSSNGGKSDVFIVIDEVVFTHSDFKAMVREHRSLIVKFWLLNL